MGWKLRRIGWGILLFSGTLLGCHKSAVQHKEPPDPLLVTKPPVEGRPHAAHASPLAHTQPTPPPPVPMGDTPESP
ncbi:MAG TPA: hypothetical protein VN688_22645 [Gemmataceae bacterium]|nr:hypothetical protein [Gemmataceae bacterium]